MLSRLKSRYIELATSITRTLKFSLVKLFTFQTRPQVLLSPPRLYVARTVPSIGVLLAAVQDTPPFHDSCTQIFGETPVLSTLAFKRT